MKTYLFPNGARLTTFPGAQARVCPRNPHHPYHSLPRKQAAEALKALRDAS